MNLKHMEMIQSIEVEMIAFGRPGEIRTVDIPVATLLHPEYKLLEVIFHYGQNDFQPQPHPSVSVGDVINFEHHRYLVLPLGFYKLNADEYETYLSSDTRNIDVYKFKSNME